MSDFDREAERERLREQFEEDEQKREQSERMSELLLKGATMTNVHCDRCGDPIFRWDGQEFCPTCQGGPGGEPTATTTDADETAASDRQSAESAREPRASDAQPTDDGESTVEVEPESSADRTATDSPPTDPERTPSRARQPRREPAETPSGPANDDLATARASLGRTLATLAEQAERADDLSRTREYLTAAKEAAEALDAAEGIR